MTDHTDCPHYEVGRCTYPTGEHDPHCLVEPCVIFDELSGQGLITPIAEDERKLAALPALVEALEMAQKWLGYSDCDENFEAMAHWYHVETNWIAPGKSAPIGNSHSLEERREHWSQWVSQKEIEIQSAIKAALAEAKGEA